MCSTASVSNNAVNFKSRVLLGLNYAIDVHCICVCVCTNSVVLSIFHMYIMNIYMCVCIGKG